MFDIDVETRQGSLWLRLRGELDLATVDSLRAAIPDMGRGDSGHLVVDLRELEFIDSTGMRVLLEADKAALKSGWKVTFIRGNDAIHRVFQLLGVDKRVHVVDALNAHASQEDRSG